MLTDLNDPQAVHAAITEFDRLGRDEFLARTGFGRAKRYFVVENGRRYDSKAIAGAAYAIQFPDRPRLASPDFRGGERRTVPVLRRLGFEVEGVDVGTSNPDWDTDELLLALDVYLRHAPLLPPKQHPDVLELSDLLKTLHRERSAPSYRNVNSVNYKLANFAFHNPDHIGSSASNGGTATELAWRLWSGRREELRRIAATIRHAITRPEGPPREAVDGEAEAPEGRVLYRLHKVTERNRALRAKKVNTARATTGRLACEACDTDLAERYGDLAEGIIDVHHVIALSESGEVTSTLDDLALLCPNCHRVIHRRQVMTTWELKRLVLRDPTSSS